MTVLAAALLGAAVALVTIALWPRTRAPEPSRFVEDERVPRTLH